MHHDIGALRNQFARQHQKWRQRHERQRCSTADRLPSELTMIRVQVRSLIASPISDCRLHFANLDCRAKNLFFLRHRRPHQLRYHFLSVLPVSPKDLLIAALERLGFDF